MTNPNTPDGPDDVSALPPAPPVTDGMRGDTREGVEAALDLEGRRTRAVAQLRAREGKDYISPKPFEYNDLGNILTYEGVLSRGFLNHPEGPRAVVVTAAEIEELQESGGFVYIRADTGKPQEIDPEWVQDEFFILEPNEVGTVRAGSDDDAHEREDGE